MEEWGRAPKHQRLDGSLGGIQDADKFTALMQHMFIWFVQIGEASAAEPQVVHVEGKEKLFWAVTSRSAVSAALPLTDHRHYGCCWS